MLSFAVISSAHSLCRKPAMVYSVLGPLLLVTLHSSACLSPNGSLLEPRTFSGHSVSAHDDAVDHLDLSALDALGESGSGSIPDQLPVRKPVRRRVVELHVSNEAKAFLQGRLATLFVPTFYAAVFVVSVPLNLVAVVMFVRYIRPRKPAVIYMLNLSCTDLFFGLLLPFKISYHYHGNDWIYGDWMCRAVTAAFYCNMYCSVLLISSIGVDRFLAVVHPIDSLTRRSPRNAAVVCVSIWLFALAGVSPLLFSTQTVSLPQLGITTCHDVQDAERLHSYFLYFFLAYVSLFFFLPLVLTVACYVRIIQALSAASVGDRSRKTRALIMTALVLVMFVICFTPTNVLLVLHYAQLSRHGSSDSSYQAYLLSLCVGSLSCCIDPLLYYFGSSQCQRQVLVMFRARREAALRIFKSHRSSRSDYESSIQKVETLGSRHS